MDLGGCSRGCSICGNLVNHAHARGYLTEDRVLWRKLGTSCSHNDKELATICIRTGVSHCDCTNLVRTSFRKLIAKLVTGPTGTSSGRVSSLHNEARDDPLEDDSVKEVISRQINKVIHCLGCSGGIECDDEATHVGRNRCAIGGCWCDAHWWGSREFGDSGSRS